MSSPSARPTIGFLSTWSVYQGATIDGYTYTLLQGISAAAREHGCNLLLGCGISLPASTRASRTAWSVSGDNADFIPVGPWNTHGLIITPDDLSNQQFAYLEDLVHAGLPIVMTTAEIPGLALNNSQMVTVDNAYGIRQALLHLFAHGHRRIAFVAGKSGRGGDSAERLAAYRETLREANIPYDPRLVAFGEHWMREGHAAMQRILATGAPFTALVASNDLSCLGALEVLRAAGKRIPEDVAVIGFDDILEARSQLPPLTTVRHPTFALGYQSVVTLLETIQTRASAAQTHSPAPVFRIPTQLVVRQSCGCRPESAASKISFTPKGSKQTLAHEMAQATLVEARHSSLQELEPRCLELVKAFQAALAQNDNAPFDRELQHLTQWLDEHNEDAFAWHAAISNLRSLIPPSNIRDGGDASFAHTLIDRARLEIAEHAQRQATDILLQHMEMSNRLGLMTAQLLAVLDSAQGAAILAEHLPHLGIEHALVAKYVPRDDDPYACATVLIDTRTAPPHSLVGQEFSPRAFPPDDLTPNVPLQWALLPLVIAQPHAASAPDANEVPENAMGFVALALQPHAPLTSLESCAAITHNLGAALRSGSLYHDALEGRRLAEEANSLKSRFLSTVSHELRTPLSLIVGLADMVLEQKRDALSTTSRRDLEQIHASAQHLGRLISDVLDLASSEAGQLRLAREPIDLAAEMNQVALIGAEMAREKGLQWHAAFDYAGTESSAARVIADRTRIRQIVLNLLSNAVKFTTRGKIALDVRVDARHATISVSDTGIGIAPQDQMQLFREFQRAERTIAAGYGGMGLGLAISKHLVEQHGGTIGVRSPGDFGSGATFYFTLPLLRDELYTSFDAQQLAYTLDTPPSFQPLTPDLLDAALEPAVESSRPILVVDDDREILALHCRLVEQLGHRALPARNGREALELVQAERPALVLLDLMMPELDGFHVLDALRAGETTRDIPVIVLTARALDENDIERLSRGVAAIMAKGLFHSSETLQHIQAALEQQRTLVSPTRRLVRRAMGFIHEQYAEPLTREQIAAHVNISPDYLTDCFRQEVGVTPMVYLNRYRLKQARDLLENSDMKIAQIALAVGFSESAHFTRMFQREVGVTPRAWRQGHRA